MAIRMFSNKEMLAVIRRRLTGSAAVQLDAQALLDECDLAIAELSGIGDEVWGGGWIWLQDQYAFSVPALTSSVNATIPGFHHGITLRAANGTSAPRSYAFVNASHALAVIDDTAERGPSAAVWINDYDSTTDLYQLTFYPVPTAAMTCTLVYQRGIEAMTDSPLLSDRVRWPAQLVEAIAIMTCIRIFRIYDLHKRADKMLSVDLPLAINRCKIHHLNQMQEAPHATTKTEDDIAAGRRTVGDPFFWPERA